MASGIIVLLLGTYIK